jgi:hypothetical protein
MRKEERELVGEEEEELVEEEGEEEEGIIRQSTRRDRLKKWLAGILMGRE